MNFIIYCAAALISFCGLFCGLALSIMAKEEVKQGKRYLLLLQKVLLASILIFFSLDSTSNEFLIITIVLSALFVYVSNLSFRHSLIYLLLGLVFFISSKNQNIFLLQSSLIFLYGFPEGSLFFGNRLADAKSGLVGGIWRILLAYLWFVFLSIILFVVA